MQSLKILSVYDRLFLRKAKFMFKVYNGLTPSNISEKFILRNEMDMSFNLRSSASGCFIPPLPKKECFKQSMRYSGCLVWNCLPNNDKCSQTAETFYNRCIKWLTRYCDINMSFFHIFSLYEGQHYKYCNINNLNLL